MGTVPGAGGSTDQAADAPAPKKQHRQSSTRKAQAPADDGLGFLRRIPGSSSSSNDGSKQKHHPARRLSRDGGPGDAVKPISLAAVSALSMFYGVKGLLKGYQQLRRRNLRHLICTVAPVLDELGATYWLDFGSLLGAHREGDVIIHDNDADVSGWVSRRGERWGPAWCCGGAAAAWGMGLGRRAADGPMH